MKRWLLCAPLLLAAALLATGENGAARDIGTLEPAQVLLVEESAGRVLVYTDVGHFGQGADLSAAVADMERTAAGYVFLDTAEYLLVDPSALAQMTELSRWLRPSCRMCATVGVKDLTAAGEYLSNHKPSVTLGDIRKGNRDLPILYMEGERMYLANP